MALFRIFCAKIIIPPQCCGSESGSGSTGSTCFWASRILLSSCKNSKKNLYSYCFVTLFDFLSLKNDVMYLQKVTSRKNCVKNQFFACIMKVSDENSRIRIPIHQSGAWICGSGSTPICHGSVPPSSLLRAEGFSCSWVVLNRGLGISKQQFMIKKRLNFFPAENYFNYWSSNHWIQIRINIQPKMQDPDPESINLDPEH